MGRGPGLAGRGDAMNPARLDLLTDTLFGQFWVGFSAGHQN